MKNLKKRILYYIIAFIVVTIAPVISLPVVFGGAESTSNYLWLHLLVWWGTYFIFLNVIYFIEVNKDFAVFGKTLLMTAGVSLILSLVSAFATNGYVGADSTNRTKILIWAYVISGISIILFLPALNLILLTTTNGNRNKELIVRKLFFLLINNFSWDEKDGLVLLTKKNKSIAVLYLNQKDNVEIVQWSHEKEIIGQQDEVKDFFSELDNKPASVKLIEDDNLASKIREYANEFAEVAVFYESEKQVSSIGNKPSTVTISNLTDFSETIKKIYEDKNE